MTRLPRLSVATLAAILAGPACRPVTEPPPPAGRFVPPTPQPRRTLHPQPELIQWVTAWQGVQKQVSSLQQELQQLQQIHLDNHFDSFLDLDPESLDLSRLTSLFHFLERGYFTIEREILVRLLERRIARQSSPVALPPDQPASLQDRVASALQRDELRTVDLETALEFYRRPGGAEFTIPDSLSETETTELRNAVAAMLTETRDRIGSLDRQIANLRQQAGLPAPAAIPPMAPPPAPETNATSPDEPQDKLPDES